MVLKFGEKASLCKGSQADRAKQSFALLLEVGFTSLEAAHEGGQQHGAETRQKLGKIHFYHFDTYTL